MNATATATEAPAQRWGSRERAKQILGVGEFAVERLVQAGSLTVRQLPGTRRLYDLDQVRRLAEESTRVAVG